MRILICDDDILIIKQLENYIRSFFSQYNSYSPEIITYTSGEALLQDKEDKDIVFLDIEMPGIDGIHVGNTLKREKPNILIIVVTSYPDYLDDAMRFHVFRYLSKPLNKERLSRNLKDALESLNTAHKQIIIETQNGTHSVSTADIVCIEAQLRNTIIRTTAKDHISNENLQYWQKKLKQPCFFQSHRSFIINLAFVTDFNNTIVHLFNNQITAHIAQRKYKEFKSYYLFYLESTR